jgi:hypothetical protein
VALSWSNPTGAHQVHKPKLSTCGFGVLHASVSSPEAAVNAFGIADRRAPDRRSPGDAPDEIGRSEPARNLKTVA